MTDYNRSSSDRFGSNVPPSRPESPFNRKPENPENLSEGELDRVREIILGPDAIKQRLQKPEVERLRDILVGEQNEEYNRRFNDVRRDTDRTLNDVRQIQDKVTDIERSQMQGNEALNRQIKQLNQELRRHTDELRTHLAMFQQLQNQIRQQEAQTTKLMAQNKEQGMLVMQQEEEIRALKTTVQDHRDMSERKINGVKRELRDVEDKLYAEIHRLIDRLSEQKTDRKSLSAMLMEVATRLETGSSVTNLLEDLTGPTPE